MPGKDPQHIPSPLTELAGAIDFNHGKNSWRRKQGRKNELLVKALGLKKLKNPVVLDGTAGLGRDSFIIASLGCQVLMVERSADIHALLANALDNALNNPELATICQQMQLFKGDLFTFSPPQPVDVVYLDPMYPHRRKSALVKKEMRLLRQVVGDDRDSDALLVRAKEIAQARVVVKRPKGAPFLNEQPPNHAIKGKKGRFDIYLPPFP